MALQCLPALPIACAVAAVKSRTGRSPTSEFAESARRTGRRYPSSFLAGDCVGLQSFVGSRSEFCRSGGEIGRVGRRKVKEIEAGYGIQDYGIPQPPYSSPTSPPPVRSGKSSAKSGAKVSSEIPRFLQYATPSDYASPRQYGAPKNYGIPAYGADVSARVAVVEVEASNLAQGLEAVIESVSGSTEAKEAEPDLGGGEGGAGKEGGGGGGGGDDGDGGAGDEEQQKKMSMSQKLTLAYAALVGIGGVIGFAKSGSAKSLVTGGGAALALYYVYSQLPVNPVFASSFGLGISAVLLAIMGPRFTRSGKFMPSGLVALFSLVMTGGYLHGIVRSHR